MRILHPVSLDARLSLVYDLYDPCDLAADIGTDHARLPAALLQRGRCCRMILTDISPDALENARREIIRCGLSGKADLRLGDGLSPLPNRAVSFPLPEWADRPSGPSCCQAATGCKMLP